MDSDSIRCRIVLCSRGVGWETLRQSRSMVFMGDESWMIEALPADQNVLGLALIFGALSMALLALMRRSGCFNGSRLRGMKKRAFFRPGPASESESEYPLRDSGCLHTSQNHLMYTFSCHLMILNCRRGDDAFKPHFDFSSVYSIDSQRTQLLEKMRATRSLMSMRLSTRNLKRESHLRDDEE